jgi:hypothetical protein
MSKWSPSDYAAWWGATLATIVLVWDIIKHYQSGPKIRIRFKRNQINSRPAMGVILTNIGNETACMERIRIGYYSAVFGFRKNIEHDKIFTLWLQGIGFEEVINLGQGQTLEGHINREDKGIPFTKSRYPNTRYISVEISESHSRLKTRKYFKAEELHESI